MFFRPASGYLSNPAKHPPEVAQPARRSGPSCMGPRPSFTQKVGQQSPPIVRQHSRMRSPRP